MSKNIKELGQVFTPSYIVEELLNFCNYNLLMYNNQILRKHIIDNSCGEGGILCEIVERYCTIYFYAVNDDKEALKNELETYIHGIDIDKNAIEKCIFNLNKVVEKYNIFNVNWDIFQGDSLKETRFNGKMDYVIGNPPYIRTHNLKENYESVKNFEFSKKGMSDMYIVFFEIGIKMLNNSGKLCYITPSSWVTSKSGELLREYFKATNILEGIIDFKHHKVFKKCNTYSMITYLDKSSCNLPGFKYYHYNEENGDIEYIDILNCNEIEIDGGFYFNTKTNINKLKEIKNDISEKTFFVKNGIATLLDKVFINNEIPFNEYTTQCLKASTGQWKKCFFPYHNDGTAINPEIIHSKEEVISYLSPFKASLTKRKVDKGILDYFYFGRQQGLKETGIERLAINNIIKDKSSLKINILPKGSTIYSGLYIYSNNADLNIAKEILETDDFIDYIKSLNKYKSGGYYTFNTKDVENYLNYNYAKRYKNNKSC